MWIEGEICEMKNFKTKLLAVICCVAVALSMTACGGSRHGSSGGGRRTESGTKPEGGRGTDPTYTSETGTDPTSDPTTDPTTDPTSGPGGYGNYIPTSDTLTYPDHVATYEEVHPSHSRGNVSGTEAAELLSDVEYTLIHHDITDYVDIVIYFEHPEDFGFSIDEVSWGDISSVDQLDETREFYQGQLDLLLTIDYESLSGDDRLCYDKIVYDLEESIYSCSYSAFNYYTMLFNYLVGPQSEVLFIMDVIQFDTVKDAENYILLMKDIDRYYDEMCEYEETRASLGFASSDTSYEEAAKSFDNLVKQKDDCFLYESFEERLDNISGLSSADRSRLISEHEKAMKEVVFPEFEECAERMRALKGSGGVDAGLCEYRGGDAYYAMITRQMTNKSTSPEASAAALDRSIDDTYTELTATVSKNITLYYDFLKLKLTKGGINENLDYLRQAVKADFPDIPAHEYYIMDVPEVFEENFSPAAYLGFHLDDYNDNLIIVNNSNVDDKFGTTVAHEAYPGHMFQSLYTRSHTKHPYMYLGGSTGYMEGWATYVEHYSAKYFVDPGNDDLLTLAKDNDVFTLLVSTRIDYGIHLENWSLQECVDYLNGFGLSVTSDDLAQIYTLVVTDPGYYAKYGMGYLWTQKIMDNLHERHPNASEKAIHTAYLDAGTGTFEQIEAKADSLLN